MSENSLHLDRTVGPRLALSILSPFLLTETKTTLLTLTRAGDGIMEQEEAGAAAE